MAEAVKTHIRDLQECAFPALNPVIPILSCFSLVLILTQQLHQDSKVSNNIQELINEVQEALAVEVKFVYIKVEELADRIDVFIDQNDQAPR
jgi:hypothetical protein